MTWHDIDLFQFEAALFKGRVENLVVRIYLAALQKVEGFYAEAFEKIKQQMVAAQNDGDQLEVWNEREMLQYEKYEQLQALATMALAMLGALIEAFLRDTAKRMNHTHPQTGKQYESDKLERRIAEYGERFDTDLTAIPGFEGAREVVLARNSCLHRAGQPSPDYLEQTKCRLVDDAYGGDKINLTPTQLDQLSREVCDFADVLYQRLGEVRRQKKGVANERQTR